MLAARELCFSYGSVRVLDDVHLQLGAGVTAIIGPNAAGKSTLLKCLSGLLRPRGQIFLDGREISSLSREQIARRVAYLPQDFAPQSLLTVFETVLLGRVHTLGWRVAPNETRLVERLLNEIDLADVSQRYIYQLSGGQARLAAIAQALAREPQTLLLDEPTANLDLRRQFEVCDLIRTLSQTRGISAAIVLHDLNMAARVADTVCLLQDGKVRCAGSPGEVLTEELIGDVYGVEARVSEDESGRPCVTVLRPSARLGQGDKR